MTKSIGLISFWLQLLRVKQWIKNAFIFFPLIFSGRVLEDRLTLKTAIVFLGFSLVASALYIINDLIDRKKDKLHPKKAQRILTASNLNKNFIFALVGALQITGVYILIRIEPLLVFPIGIYILVNLLYNLFAKRIVLLDVMFIAFGFHLRIWTGAIAVSIIPSVWLQLCVFLLALFLGFTKRRNEFSILKERAYEHRAVLSHYTISMLDQVIIICSTLAIVFYGLYTISPEITQRYGGSKMIFSIIFVIYGMFRYLYLMHVKQLGDDPSEVLLTDFPLLFCVLSWICYLIVVLYLYPHV